MQDRLICWHAQGSTEWHAWTKPNPEPHPLVQGTVSGTKRTKCASNANAMRHSWGFSAALIAALKDVLSIELQDEYESNWNMNQTHWQDWPQSWWLGFIVSLLLLLMRPHDNHGKKNGNNGKSLGNPGNEQTKPRNCFSLFFFVFSTRMKPGERYLISGMLSLRLLYIFFFEDTWEANPNPSHRVNQVPNSSHQVHPQVSQVSSEY